MRFGDGHRSPSRCYKATYFSIHARLSFSSFFFLFRSNSGSYQTSRHSLLAFSLKRPQLMWHIAVLASTPFSCPFRLTLLRLHSPLFRLPPLKPAVLAHPPTPLALYFAPCPIAGRMANPRTQPLRVDSPRPLPGRKSHPASVKRPGLWPTPLRESEAKTMNLSLLS